MGKEEIKLRIRLHEEVLKNYIKASDPSIRDDEAYKATLERMRMTLSSLYMEMENFERKKGYENGKEES
ncbi:MAG: hypothetical protein K6F74_05950 [Prevotella sp.]|nr:hypothetical protein [Prevotella sp.]